jgi:serine protease AprX
VRSLVVRALAVALLGGLVAAAPATAAAKAPATYIVQLRAGVPDAHGRALVRAAGGQVTGSVHLIHALVARLSRADAAALRRQPDVRALTINARVRPQDVVNGSRLQTAYPWSVSAPYAWPYATGEGVGVAVIDTGIAGQLQDFVDDDGTSRVKASVVTNPDATTPEDTYGHGTHVAGILAGNGGARNPSDPDFLHYLGIAPDANLISIKAADDDGNATVLDVIYGLQFVVDHQAAYNIRVVNLSLESTAAESYRTDPLDAAVESAYFHGVLVVAAAGNRGGSPDAGDYAPGNDPWALSVGAVDDNGTATRSDDTVASWSSSGTTQDGVPKPDILAPGAHIVSTLAPGSAFESLCPSCVVPGGYFRAGGTSMAAPVVSGAAAVVIDRHPSWSAAQVKAALLATARSVGGTNVREVNVAAAMQMWSPPATVDPNLPPSDIVDPASGAVDYTRSSWSRSSWSTAAAGLTAAWARSSWSCTCAGGDGEVDPTRSSWSRSSWSTKWDY